MCVFAPDTKPGIPRTSMEVLKDLSNLGKRTRAELASTPATHRQELQKALTMLNAAARELGDLADQICQEEYVRINE